MVTSNKTDQIKQMRMSKEKQTIQVTALKKEAIIRKLLIQQE